MSGMYLAAYHFDGDPERLSAAHDTMIAALPADNFALHLCVTRADGITVFDSCPSEADFVAFQADPGFRAAIADAGLPEPRIEPIGEVHALLGHRTVVS